MATTGGPFGSKNRNVSRQTVPARRGGKSQNQGNRTMHSPAPSTAISVRSSNMRSHLITPTDKVVVGLDYGTTFTSVSYSIVPINCGNMKGSANDVLSVINWPSDGEDGERKQVPTESWYSPEPVERHWNDEDEIFDENLFDLSQGQHPLLLSGAGGDTINEPEDSEMEDELPEASRVLQTSVKAAIQATAFGKPWGTTADNIFLVSEPEAAATFLLESSEDISLGETFIIADCGGGTVDVVTYGVSNRYPLRLKDEKIQPIGDNCGSSYLNDGYRDMLLNRFQDEDYLFKNGDTLESIVNRLIPDFENEYKRRVNVMKRCGHRVYIAGLRGDERMNRVGPAEKRFEANYLRMTLSDYKEIFDPLLKRVSNLLKNQIGQAVEKNLVVKKVFLVGGSPSLRSYLKNWLAGKFVELTFNIELVADRHKCITAVASGAVLRALDKKNGPERISQSSYGFLRHEPWQPRLYLGHERTRPDESELDGEKYVATIDYFMVKGNSIRPDHQFSPFPTYHTFPIDEKKFLCEEVLYVSDTATESHYSRRNLKNADAQIAGRIIVDMTFLRDKGIITPVYPEEGMGGKEHYRVEYELVAKVEGRALRYEARYPAGEGGKVRGEGKFSIAAAFREGTA
ncbi:hypothetical protein BCON_0203g00020 [Botryotinia convoluta]|uniref:Uncharacterized protein n=1 Tax=Botryotinia convoluta TaxID=54673 RepID=A0A4Z1HM16_9HELO|nr:hypothetical protein BCON_0203g00020 [Botryotinia convoluta]